MAGKLDKTCAYGPPYFSSSSHDFTYLWDLAELCFTAWGSTCQHGGSDFSLVKESNLFWNTSANRITIFSPWRWHNSIYRQTWIWRMVILLIVLGNASVNWKSSWKLVELTTNSAHSTLGWNTSSRSLWSFPLWSRRWQTWPSKGPRKAWRVL